MLHSLQMTWAATLTSMALHHTAMSLIIFKGRLRQEVAQYVNFMKTKVVNNMPITKKTHLDDVGEGAEQQALVTNGTWTLVDRTAP